MVLHDRDCLHKLQLVVTLGEIVDFDLELELGMVIPHLLLGVVLVWLLISLILLLLLLVFLLDFFLFFFFLVV